MAKLVVVSRAQWGFPGWRRDEQGRQQVPPSVPDSRRTEFFVHYEGGVPTKDVGAQAMRAIHAVHLGRGWAGIGYGHVVFQDGSIFEGRGWTLVGAHCPDHNTTGYSAQVHIGGDQEPTPAALRSVRWLYDEACRRAGRALAKRGHRDGYATDCPGPRLYAWVRAGMLVPAAEPMTSTTMIPGGHTMFVIKTPSNGSFAVWPNGDHMAWVRLDDAVAARWVAGGVQQVNLSAADATALMHLQASVQDVLTVPPAIVDVRALAAELVPLLPQGTALTADAIADRLAARLAQ